MQVLFGAMNAEVSDDGRTVAFLDPSSAKGALVLPALQAHRSQLTRSLDAEIVTAPSPPSIRSANLTLDGRLGVTVVLCAVVIAFALKWIFRLSASEARTSERLDGELDYASFMRRYGGDGR